MPREMLPNRRQNETATLRHDGHEFTVTIGYDSQGRPKEVFANASKSGTAMSHILADACVIISLALQFGAAPSDLAKSLGRIPAPELGEDADRPASVLGAILELVESAQSPWPKTGGHDAA